MKEPISRPAEVSSQSGIGPKAQALVDCVKSFSSSWFEGQGAKNKIKQTNERTPTKRSAPFLSDRVAGEGQDYSSLERKEKEARAATDHGTPDTPLGDAVRKCSPWVSVVPRSPSLLIPPSAGSFLTSSLATFDQVSGGCMLPISLRRGLLSPGTWGPPGLCAAWKIPPLFWHLAVFLTIQVSQKPCGLSVCLIFVHCVCSKHSYFQHVLLCTYRLN